MIIGLTHENKMQVILIHESLMQIPRSSIILGPGNDSISKEIV
uniref:Uncharacterized protein n=1 Tax=Rhizophora mucronata TaxID=61149 RepID=A0A2P2PIH6_RHIMU